MPVRLRKKELAKAVGVNPRTILDWTKRGYIVPMEINRGRGKTSYYGARNVVEALILKSLSEHGIPLKLYHDLRKLR